MKTSSLSLNRTISWRQGLQACRCASLLPGIGCSFFAPPATRSHVQRIRQIDLSGVFSPRGVVAWPCGLGSPTWFRSVNSAQPGGPTPPLAQFTFTHRYRAEAKVAVASAKRMASARNQSLAFVFRQLPTWMMNNLHPIAMIGRTRAFHDLQCHHQGDLRTAMARGLWIQSCR